MLLQVQMPRPCEAQMDQRSAKPLQVSLGVTRQQENFQSPLGREGLPHSKYCTLTHLGLTLLSTFAPHRILDLPLYMQIKYVIKDNAHILSFISTDEENNTLLLDQHL